VNTKEGKDMAPQREKHQSTEGHHTTTTKTPSDFAYQRLVWETSENKKT